MAQGFAQQTGSAAPTNFDAAKAALSGEVSNTLKASGATDQEIAHVSAVMSRVQSPAQLKGAISTFTSLLTSKRDQLKNQYQSGIQGKPFFGDEDNSGAGNTGSTGRRVIKF